ncbi:MAG: RsmB/NOP family class I SAM-dependent RNA methyltransferase [Nanoarchaeota archaeon]|nr:RsmB/NOP family class I SAM-dependent RNA methyltransferase [Nanoarchaeota archaeon]
MKFPQPKPLFLERMQKLLPDKKDFQNYMEILKILPVRSIRCNKLKISPSELKKKLESKGWKIQQPWPDYPEIMVVEGKLFVHSHSQIDIDNKIINKENSRNVKQVKPINKKIFSLTEIPAEKSSKDDFVANQLQGKTEQNLTDLEPGELGRSLEHLLGYYYIQELASMLPVIVLNPEKNELILDLCASPGSKTTQLSSEIGQTGIIIANEVSIGRLKILASNLERCGASNTIITRKEGTAFCNRMKKNNFEFDKILVDAPCSGEGTLRSSPKTYAMWNIKTIKNLPKIQTQLVFSALEILKPNGILVYSTCTHAPEENEGVIDAVLKEFKDKVKLEKIFLPIKFREGITNWEDKKFSKEVKKCARIYPQDNNTEGFFIARFRKLG